MTKEFPSSLAVEGELPENSLAAYGLDGGRVVATNPEVSAITGKEATGKG